MSQMMQMNQILGDVKDLLRQQVLYKVFSVKYPRLATFESQGRIHIGNKLLCRVHCLRGTAQQRRNNHIGPATLCLLWRITECGSAGDLLIQIQKIQCLKWVGTRAAILAHS